MHPDELLQAIRREGAALARAASHDLSVQVPSCPGWTVETVLNHLGRVHRWATIVVRTRATDRPDFPPRPPVIDHEWFEEGVEELASALEEAGPDAECWNFMDQPRRARFWFRREAHETAVHRWDVQHAHGRADAVETELALDGIDELLDVIAPLNHQGRDLGGTVHLHATDSPHGEWLIATRDGELLVGHDHQKGDAAVRGSASDLLLWLWGRVPTGSASLEVFGDESLAHALHDVLKAP